MRRREAPPSLFSRITGVASQPLWLHWEGERGRRRHAPDYFARRRDGICVVVDVRADDRILDADAEAFAVTAQACAQVGWEFRRVGEIEPVLRWNGRWLARYRHPRCAGRDEIATGCGKRSPAGSCDAAHPSSTLAHHATTTAIPAWPASPSGIPRHWRYRLLTLQTTNHHCGVPTDHDTFTHAAIYPDAVTLAAEILNSGTKPRTPGAPTTR